jgi:hypothetical protein
MRTAVAVLLLTIPGLGTSGPRVAEGRVTGERPAEKRAPRFAKLDVGLNRALATERPLAEVEHLGFRTHGSRVQVVVVTEVHRAPEAEHWLASRGATFVVSVGNLVQAFVDVALVPALDAHEDVLYVRRPLYIPRPPPGRGEAGTKSLAATTEGLAAMNADAWHAAGVRGQGVRVAVIDRGFQGYDALLGSDLPEAARVSTSAVGGAVFDSTTHGTACAEVVFDVVPDLERMTLLAVATEVDIASAISEAQGDGVDVVSMSLGWLPWGPNDGTGLIADAIDAFVAAGGMVVVSAGDERLTHWQGTWNDPGGDDFLDFAHGGEENYLTVAGGPDLWSVPAGTEISVAMVWNQWVAPETDLDLYLYRWSGTGDPYAVDMSEDYQTGVLGELPIEQLTYTVPTDLGGYFGVGVTYWSGPLDVEIEIIVRPDLNPLQDNVQEGSVIVPADTATAIAVAALDVDAPDELESYSSMGPTNGPGGSLSGGAVKPDISGFANVSTATYGAGAFPGTAAACPHVAGAAVLVWSAHPEWSNTQVRDYLESNAVDLGLPGKDNDHGHGRLQLGDPPVPSCDPPATPTGLAATDEAPASGATYEISWSAVADAASYQLQEATDTAFSDASTVTVAGTSKAFSHDVSNDTDYYYRVRARRDCGSESPWTAAVKVTVTTGSACASPDTPPNLESSLSAPYPDEPYTLSWDVVDDADMYELREADNPDFHESYAYYTYSPSKKVSHSVDEPTPYYYKVRARRECGSRSDWSEVVEVVVAPAGSEEPWFYLVPGMARAPGANDTRWRSSLAVFNPGERSADLDITFRTDSGTFVSYTVVPPGATREWLDVVVELFGEGSSLAGAVAVVSSRRVIVTARTYNLSDVGTFGQYLPGCRVEDALSSDGVGYLPQIKGGDDFRTNIGFINFGGVACTVVVTLHDEVGEQIGSSLTVVVEPGAWMQTNDVFTTADAGSCQVGHAMVEVLTADCSVWGYASVVDQATGDPTTIPLFVE